MLLIETRLPPQAGHDAILRLPFELRQKSRLRTRLESGEEVGLFLPHGTILRGGEFLRANDGRVVRVESADEQLMHIRCATDTLMVQAAYHLGNRHVPVQVGEGWLRFQADEVLAQMLRRMEATVESVVAPFEPEAGAYAPGHQHHSMDARHSGIIHEFKEFKKS